MTGYPADLAAIEQAAIAIAGHVHETPLLSCETFSHCADRRLYFKCENLQKIGAFKIRGGLNAVMALHEAVASHGVVTHSSGNFAQAVALAAKMRGIPAHIVMPSNAPGVKRRAVAGYGARIIECEPTLQARTRTANAVVAETGGALLHPYNQREVIAGQGTIGLELIRQQPNLDAVVVPVGGGGLIAGIALALREVAPHVAVYGAEPAGADDAARSKQAGELIPQTGPDTIADGLLTSLGDLTWPVIRDLVEDVIVVDDEATIRAMQLVFERMKLVIEPSAAVALAAAWSARFLETTSHQHVAVIFSGGNVDLAHLPWQR